MKFEFGDLMSSVWSSCANLQLGEQSPLIQYQVMLGLILQKGDIKRGLELGGGYSTVVLSKLALDQGVRITSIDINPAKYSAILQAKTLRTFLFSLIDVRSIPSVSFQRIADYYQNEFPSVCQKIAHCPDEGILESYIKPCDQKFGSYMNLDRMRYSNEFINRIAEQVYSNTLFNKERRFFESSSISGDRDYIDEISDSEVEFDFIFFDCGELSSLVEFHYLEKRIPVGGYAFLHDIYFPKSIKNYVVSVLLEMAANWEIVYRDTSTPQGFLAARKVGT